MLLYEEFNVNLFQKYNKYYQVPIDIISFSNDIASELLLYLNYKYIKKENLIAIVSDEITFEILAKNIVKLLSPHYKIKNIVLYSPKANDTNCNKLQKELESIELVIAVGSGTISDIVKYNSYKLGISYIMLPTAPSMNGYSSTTASIKINSIQKSLKAHLPIAIFIDYNIISAAPLRLIKAGISDSICGASIQIDWIIATELRSILPKEYPNINYTENFYKDIAILEKKLYRNINDIINKKEEKIKILMTILLMQGIIGYLSETSLPISQGEHIMAHFINMITGNMNKFYHGEHIAVTSNILKRYQKSLLASDNIKIKLTKMDYIEQEYAQLNDNNLISKKEFSFLLEKFEKELLKKLTISNYEDNNLILLEKWKNIKEIISKKKLVELFKDNIILDLDLNKDHKDVNISKELLNFALKYAHISRDRFTSLDLEKI